MRLGSFFSMANVKNQPELQAIGWIALLAAYCFHPKMIIAIYFLHFSGEIFPKAFFNLLMISSGILISALQPAF